MAYIDGLGSVYNLLSWWACKNEQMDRGSGSHYTIPYILTVNDLLRVSPRIPLYCLIHCYTQSDHTLSGNRLWRPAIMRRRSMTLVLSVMLQILTVRNCAESKTDVPVLYSESDRQTVFGVAIGVRWKRRLSTLLVKQMSRWFVIVVLSIRSLIY